MFTSFQLRFRVRFQSVEGSLYDYKNTGYEFPFSSLWRFRLSLKAASFSSRVKIHSIFIDLSCFRLRNKVRQFFQICTSVHQYHPLRED